MSLTCWRDESRGEEVSSLRKGFLRFDASVYRNPRRLARPLMQPAFRPSALCGLLAALMTLSCGTAGHATLELAAPPNVTAGTPFTITVSVLYQGKPDTVINSPIHFTSTDPGAVLPGNYYFTPSDAGSHTWTNGFILATPGTQTITGYIYDDASVTESGINGSASITVSP
jgi:hypothetical protein